MLNRVKAEAGRKGGLIGGKRRLETMSAEQRSEVSRIAAVTRWGNATDAQRSAQGRMLARARKRARKLAAKSAAAA